MSYSLYYNVYHFLERKKIIQLTTISRYVLLIYYIVHNAYNKREQNLVIKRCRERRGGFKGLIMLFVLKLPNKSTVTEMR